MAEKEIPEPVRRIILHLTTFALAWCHKVGVSEQRFYEAITQTTGENKHASFLKCLLLTWDRLGVPRPGKGRSKK